MSEKMFGGEGADQYQALWDALHGCARENGEPTTEEVYEFIENTPRTSLVCFLVDKLHEMGFKIVKEN